MGESTKSYLTGSLFPFKEKLFLMNDSTFLKGLQKAATDAGVKRYAIKRWADLRISGRKIEQLVFETESSAIATSAPSIVWTLASSETGILNSALADQMFPQGVLEPDWQWVRLDLRSSVGAWVTGIPPWTVVVDDLYLPWTHANCFILQKGSGGNWDAWLRIPYNRLADPVAWHAWARSVETVLLKRLPHGQWMCDEASLKTCPQGLLFEVDEGPWHPPAWSNFHFMAHEVLERLDFACWFDSLKKLQPRLEDSRNREVKRQRGAGRDPALHSP
jgi:hypothetical protein